MNDFLVFDPTAVRLHRQRAASLVDLVEDILSMSAAAAALLPRCAPAVCTSSAWTHRPPWRAALEEPP